MNPPGSITRTKEGGYVLHFERIIERPAAKVWAALTDPAITKNWLGDTQADLRVGGDFIIRFRESKVVMTGKITHLEPERQIEYTWLENYGMPQSLVRWTIAPEGTAACRLTLTHTLPLGCKAEDVISFGAGWHAFLDAIPMAAAGGDAIPIAFDQAAYAAQEGRYTEVFKQADVQS